MPKTSSGSTSGSKQPKVSPGPSGRRDARLNRFAASPYGRTTSDSYQTRKVMEAQAKKMGKKGK